MTKDATDTPATSFRDRLVRPIFIVSSPRSGSTLLFETLSRAPGLFTIGGESHGAIEGVPAFSVPARGWPSNRLDANDARAQPVERLSEVFYTALRDRDGQPAPGPARMLEKTPKNALRVPFFDAAWPDANFVFLYRDARQTIASMAEAWQSGHFRTYPRLPGWTGLPWSLLLVPGWRDLNGLPLFEVIARQWATAMDILLDDLAALPASRVVALDHDAFLADPPGTVDRLTKRLGLGWDEPLGVDLPLSKTTVSKPSAEKWRRHQEAIESVWPIVQAIDIRAKSFATERTA
ncbi:MAG TPA: sulfotransferase [Sphingomicrobium sp.]|nr:sulfotransferase [Sphingomicrobium sp.]